MSLLPPEVHSALSQLLRGLSTADNTVRAQAEEQLGNDWIQNRPDVLLMGLAEQLEGAEDTVVSTQHRNGGVDMRGFGGTCSYYHQQIPLSEPHSLIVTDFFPHRHVHSPLFYSEESRPKHERTPLPTRRKNFFQPLPASKGWLFGRNSSLVSPPNPQMTSEGRLVMRWPRLPDNTPKMVCTSLGLRSVVVDISGLTSGVSFLFLGDQWPELLGILFQASQSPDAGLREASFRIFSTTPSVIEKPHEDAVIGVFGKGFKDDVVSVCITGLWVPENNNINLYC